MTKHVTPKQLELAAGKSREELLIQSLPPNIDPESPAFKADAAKVERAEQQEAARAALGMRETGSLLAQAGGADDRTRERESYDDFDWTSDPSVVLQEQRATAVYRNGYGGIVIRQEKYWDEESDPCVIVCAENFVTFAEALAKKARE